MAKTVIVRAVCDRCIAAGTPGVESSEEVTFSYDGFSYALDLCAPHAEDFHNTLQALIAASTDRSPVGAARRARSASAGNGVAAATRSPRQPARRDKEQLGAIREWAKSNGYKVSDRGRIPGEIEAAFQAAFQSGR